jgi:CPA2 family monovalent cation:H+ antiporter-2
MRFLDDEDAARHMGELGVVMLMFTLGLEFNLAKLRLMRHHVFVLRALRVGLTLLSSVLMLVLLAAALLRELLPALGGGENPADALGIALLKAVLLLAVLLELGPRLMRRWFRMLARQRSHELFTLNVLLSSLFFASLSHALGLSAELGAFVARILIAETEFRVQVGDDIKPFRDLLLGLFFITIGMKLDLRELPAIWV